MCWCVGVWVCGCLRPYLIHWLGSWGGARYRARYRRWCFGFGCLLQQRELDVMLLHQCVCVCVCECVCVCVINVCIGFMCAQCRLYVCVNIYKTPPAIHNENKHVVSSVSDGWS